MLDRFLDWLSGLPPVAAYAVLVVLSAVENVFPPVPADVAVVLGAFLGHRGVTWPPLLGALCWIANTASAAGMYAYARAKGRSFLELRWPRRLVTPAALQAIERAYARHGVWGIFLSRFLPGVRAAVMPFAGIAGMPARRALLPAATASAIWYTFLVAVGSVLGLNWESARKLIDSTNRVLGLVGLLATVLAAYWLWRRSRAS